MAAPMDFKGMIDKERERLTKLATDYQAQIADINVKLAEVETEMRAITAYEDAKMPKPTIAPKAPRASSGTRAPRGSKRDELIDLITKHPNLTRGDILTTLGIKGNKTQEQSVSNALANLKKAGTITADEGRYAIAAT